MQDKNKSSQPMSDGFRVMAREKALAEQFLVIMNDFGQQDLAQYVTGITLYAEAKAEVDGLLTELEHELEQAMAPSPKNSRRCWRKPSPSASPSRLS
jgi:hypothetical protein